MSITFEETNKYIKNNYNSNFYFQTLDWNQQEWIKAICLIIDKRFEKIEKEIISAEIRATLSS